jgi:RimJ/RimL family protein N-acetyltransferase
MHVEAINIGPSDAIAPVGSVRALAGKGLAGDRHYFERGALPGQALTLIEAEALEDVGLTGAQSRRQVVVRGVRLNDLVGRSFRVGEVECRGVELCEPCLHLQQLTRPGIIKDLIHRGGLNADILTDGLISVGDPVSDGCPAPRAGAGGVLIRGSRLLLRPFRPDEIEAEWQDIVAADAMAVATPPDEARFKARLRRSGRLMDGWLDLAIDVGGVVAGRIQTFVPPGRPLPPGTFEVGIGLRQDARGRGYGREALRLLTDWLFEHAAAEVVEAPTDPANVAMRAVFRHAGWEAVGTLTEYGREWVMYRTTRRRWRNSPPAMQA